MQQRISEVNSTSPSEYLLFWALCMSRTPLTVPSVLDDTAGQTTRDNRGFLPWGISPQTPTARHFLQEHCPTFSIPIAGCVLEGRYFRACCCLCPGMSVCGKANGCPGGIFPLLIKNVTAQPCPICTALLRARAVQALRRSLCCKQWCLKHYTQHRPFLFSI